MIYPQSFFMASQLRYEKLPSGSLFPVAGSIDDFPNLHQAFETSFDLDTSGVTANIMSVNQGSSDRGVYTPIPHHYITLVRRLLWRIDVLRKMFSDLTKGPVFSVEQRFGITCNLIYALEVLRFCRPAFRAAAGEAHEVRICFFDAYMLEEHYVGRHEPSAVILWQKEHPRQNLRTDDVGALGAYRGFPQAF